MHKSTALDGATVKTLPSEKLTKRKEHVAVWNFWKLNKSKLKSVFFPKIDLKTARNTFHFSRGAIYKDKYLR